VAVNSHRPSPPPPTSFNNFIFELLHRGWLMILLRNDVNLGSNWSPMSFGERMRFSRRNCPAEAGRAILPAYERLLWRPKRGIKHDQRNALRVVHPMK